jgi:hypothetical protein
MLRKSRSKKTNNPLLFKANLVIHAADGGSEDICSLSSNMLKISKQIVKNPLYASTWKGIKDNYKTDIVKNRKYMEDMIKRRQELVELVNKEYCKQCDFNISGSTSLTSDVDVTVLNKPGSNHLFAFEEIKIMSQVLKCLLGDESLNTLDVNFYGHSFFFNENMGGVCTKNTTQRNEYYLKLDEKIESMYRFGEAFALLKIKKYYEHLDKAIKNRWKLNFRECKSILTNFIQNFSHSEDQTDLYLYTNNDSDISKKNSSYLNQLKYIDTLKKNIYNEDKDLFRYRLISEISHATVYSDESYFSYGAFMHVVYGEQMKRDLSDLPKVTFLQSMLENFGDLLKVYIESPEDVFSKGSKYMVRIFSSMKELVEDEGVTSIYKQFYAIRNVYKSNPKDPLIYEMIKESGITLDKIKDKVYTIYNALKPAKVKRSRRRIIY